MKKLLSLVLVLALVLGSFSMAFAVPADVAGTDYEDAVTALSELGVVAGYTDGNYYPEKAVNRAEAAKLVVTALGLGEYAGGNTASFTDLEGYGWAKGYIGYAEALGILKGDGNGKYRPADPVSYQEMATILVRAVGYTDASLPGTWPANYVVKAKALGFMDGIAQAGNVAANRGDVAVMIYNALDTKIGTVDAENQWNENVPADTMLARLDRAEYLGGTAFVLTEDAPVAEGVNVKAYYGALVVAYENSDHEITGIKEVKSTFLTGEMDGSKFVANDVEYTITGNNSGADYGNMVYVFENGETAATATTGAFSENAGEITIAASISGKKITKIYSEATWDGDDVKITKAMVKNIAENNKIANAYKFVEDDNYEIDTTTFILLGVDSVADIAEDDIVTAYVNASDYITKLEVSDKVVTGEITKKNAEETKITVNGTAYAMADESTFAFDAGDEVELVLNYAGDVFAATLVEGELENIAIVTDTKEAKGTWTSATTEYAIKFYTTAGETVEADLTDDVTPAAQWLEVGVIIKYDLDKDGAVTGVTNAALDLTYVTDAAVSAKGVFEGYNLTANTVVIIADGVADGTATEDFSIGKAADLYDSTITAALYEADADTDEITFIIVKSDSTSTDDVYAVVNEAWTDNTDAGYGAALIIGDEEVTVAADDLATVVTTGALKTVAYNTDGTLDVAGMDVVATDDAITASGASITVENNRIKVDGTSKGIVSENVIVYVWDDENSVWTVGDLTDVEIDLVEGDFVELYKLDSDNEDEITHVLVYQL